MNFIELEIPKETKENDLTIIYKGREEHEGHIIEPIEQIQTSKASFVEKLRYFQKKRNEINQLKEIFIHDSYPVSTFKLFILTLTDDKIRFTEDQCHDIYALSKKYEFSELQHQIEAFLNERPDIHRLIDEIKFDEVDQLKEEKLSSNLDFCLKNERFCNFPIQVLCRIINSPKRNINDHHSLFNFVKKTIDDNYKSGNKEEFQILLSSLDYSKMSNEELDELFNNERYKTVICGRNSLELIDVLLKDRKEKDRQILELQDQINDLKIVSETKIDESVNQQKKFISDFNDQNASYRESIQNQIDELMRKADEQIAAIKSQKDDIISECNRQNQDLREKLSTLENNFIKFAKVTPNILVSVQPDQSIKGTIDVFGDRSLIDMPKSRYILNTNESATLGDAAYASGFPIDSLPKEVVFNNPGGTYFMHTLLVDVLNRKSEFVSGPLYVLKVMTFSYTGVVQIAKLPQGSYKLEVWGAEGGKNSQYTVSPGKGGYSVGTLKLNKPTRLYVYVGESPSTTRGGWNGGGSGGGEAVGGGGATDIALRGIEGSSAWNNMDHLYSRIIVAGAGGGSGNSRYPQYYGGYGGGLCGQSSGCGPSDNEGTQRRAGTNYEYSSGQGFGVGGSHQGSSSGGGSGWYGGGASNNGGGGTGGAGGSGYVFTASSSSSYPSGCLLDSSFYLSDASTLAGNTVFPSPSGSGNETGHTGNGFAKITPI